MLVWIIGGAVIILGFVFCLRIMRRGMTTLEQDRKQYEARLDAGKRQLEDDRKNISSAEHLQVLKAAVDDLLHLAGNLAGYHCEPSARGMVLHTPAGDLNMELVMHESILQTTRKVLHGPGRWLLHGQGIREEFEDVATLMHRVDAYLRGQMDSSLQARHLSRRLQHVRKKATP